MATHSSLHATFLFPKQKSFLKAAHLLSDMCNLGDMLQLLCTQQMFSHDKCAISFLFSTHFPTQMESWMIHQLIQHGTIDYIWRCLCEGRPVDIRVTPASWSYVDDVHANVPVNRRHVPERTLKGQYHSLWTTDVVDYAMYKWCVFITFLLNRSLVQWVILTGDFHRDWTLWILMLKTKEHSLGAAYLHGACSSSRLSVVFLPHNDLSHRTSPRSSASLWSRAAH